LFAECHRTTTDRVAIRCELAIASRWWVVSDRSFEGVFSWTRSEVLIVCLIVFVYVPLMMLIHRLRQLRD